MLGSLLTWVPARPFLNEKADGVVPLIYTQMLPNINNDCIIVLDILKQRFKTQKDTLSIPNSVKNILIKANSSKIDTNVKNT